MVLFTDGKDLEGVTKVLDIKHMRLVRIGLRMIFAWPLKEAGEPQGKYEIMGRFFMVVQATAYVLMGLFYIKQSVGELSFITLGYTYITVLMNIVELSRHTLILTKGYRDLVGDFVNKLHLFYFKEESDYAMQTYLLVHKLSHFFTMYINISMITGLATFNAAPLLNNIISGAFNPSNLGNVTLEQAVYYSLPFDYTTNFKGYLFVFLLNLYLSYICASSFCSLDLYVSIMVFHIWGHLRILIHNINTFDVSKEESGGSGPSTKGKHYSIEENKDVFLKLSEILVYHNFIIKYVARMSDVFGYVLLIYLLFHQTTLCLLLLECSQMSTEALLRFAPLTFILIETLVQISAIFELLGSMTDKLVDAIYCLPWENMDKNNRKIVHVMLRQAQTPLNIKAMNMVSVGCQTMVSILRNSFSYFVMLRSVAIDA